METRMKRICVACKKPIGDDPDFWRFNDDPTEYLHNECYFAPTDFFKELSEVFETGGHDPHELFLRLTAALNEISTEQSAEKK